MKLKELKDWVNKLPESVLDFNISNGEIGDMNDTTYYRLDKPITTLFVDEENKDVIFFNDNQEDLTEEDIKG